MAKIVLSFDSRDSYDILKLYENRASNNLKAIHAIIAGNRTEVSIDGASQLSFNYIDIATKAPIYSWNVDSIEMEFDVDRAIPEATIDIKFPTGTKVSRADMGLPDGKYLAKTIDTRTMKISYGILDLHKNVSSFQGMFLFDIRHYNILSAKSIIVED
ncbi:hypothetical protein BRC2024_PQPTKSFJ_CDS_0154 [Tegunavirus sp. BRC001]